MLMATSGIRLQIRIENVWEVVGIVLMDMRLKLEALLAQKIVFNVLIASDNYLELLLMEMETDIKSKLV